MVGKYSRLSLLAAFSIVFILAIAGFASAMNANFTINNPSSFYNFGQNDTFNFSIGAMTENITHVVILFTSTDADPDIFVVDGNGTTASNITFRNASSDAGASTTINLTFENTTAAGIIPNGTTRNFWITVRSRSNSQSAIAFTINTTGITGATNLIVTSSLQFYPAFAFTGYVRNETGCSTCWQNGTNVTIYGITRDPTGGPSTSAALSSTMTNLSGYFRLANVNASPNFQGYQLKTIFYNVSGLATKTGMPLPEFPSFMYYNSRGGGEGGEEMFDMTLNGGTFYLQPGFTINLTATNGTSNVSFGYEVIDNALGFPVESQFQKKTYNEVIVLPANRAYTISFFRMFSFPGSSFGYLMDPTACDMNNLSRRDNMYDSTCPAPPKAYNNNKSTAVGGAVIQTNQSLVMRKTTIHGCINVQAGANNSDINITSISIKMLPWTTDTGSFVPPRSGDDGSINLTRDINITYPGCFAYYNFSLLNQTGYMLEFYAGNASLGNASANPAAANNLAAFQNLTTNDNLEVNVTLYKLAGNFYNTNTSGVSVNTSLMKVNIINSTGGLVTTNVNVNLKVRNRAAGIGTVYYIVDSQSISNGTFYVPVLNNSNYAKVMVFSQNGPPRETSMNLSASEINITVRSMGMEKGFRKFQDNGTLDTVNTTSTPIQMRFLQTTPECSIPDAPSSCEITNMSAGNFNPLKALLAGKVNMEIKITSTNVSLIFHDYDMMSAKQPPMESILEENASARTNEAGTSVQETWNFGSFAPADSYTNVTIIIPYSDSSSASTYLNDSAAANLSIPLLYDENSNLLYNSSRGDVPANLTEDFLEYNNSFYRALINSTNGINVSKEDISSVAFMNTSANYLALKVPHFSTIGAVVSGSALATTSSSTTSTSTSSGSGSGSGTTSSYWQNTFAKDDKELSVLASINQLLRIRERVSIKVNSETHHVGVVELSSTSATVNISSIPQQAVLKTGESAKFDLTNDNYYDVLITLNSIVSSYGTKANLTIASIREMKPSANAGTTDSVEDPSEDATNSISQPQGLIVDKKMPTTVWIIVIIIVLVALAVVYYFVWGKDKDIRSRVKIGQHSKDIKVH